MTHDELLAKIEYLEQYEFGKYEKTFRIFKNSLRAVVELHKPEPVWGSIEDAECNECSFGNKLVTYPCPTIQAIEKELR